MHNFVRIENQIFNICSFFDKNIIYNFKKNRNYCLKQFLIRKTKYNFKRISNDKIKMFSIKVFKNIFRKWFMNGCWNKLF